ncbi:hypothetical protein [Pseudanabaena sp. lw0831]|uniref:hypothetical protein n=1 Tax=Pseudanabaena sp. lw0831 TaxID=1357935 RepID=UPI001915F822|nr:hypothetical protein [Pseudanabaena sp. lw0831]
MKINSPFIKATCATLTTVITILSPLPCHAQSISGFPLVSFEIRIVPESLVCKLPDGYNTILKDGVSCPELNFVGEIEPLSGARIQTIPLPPNQEISVSSPDGSNNVFGILRRYREDFREARGNLPLYRRKSVVFIFDFGESHEEFDILVSGFQPIDIQKRRGCEGKEITVGNTWKYSTTLYANYRNFFYHQQADYAIPCSNVKWQLTAKGKESNQTYTWTFNTSP